MLGGQRSEDKVKLGRGCGTLDQVRGSSLVPPPMKGVSVFGCPWLCIPCVPCPSSPTVCLWVLEAEAHLCLFSKTIFSAPYHNNQSHFPGNCLSVNIPV